MILGEKISIEEQKLRNLIAFQCLFGFYKNFGGVNDLENNSPDYIYQKWKKCIGIEMENKKVTRTDFTDHFFKRWGETDHKISSILSHLCETKNKGHLKPIINSFEKNIGSINYISHENYSGILHPVVIRDIFIPMMEYNKKYIVQITRDMKLEKLNETK